MSFACPGTCEFGARIRQRRTHGTRLPLQLSVQFELSPERILQSTQG